MDKSLNSVTNFAKLAYAETEEIKKQMLIKPMGNATRKLCENLSDVEVVNEQVVFEVNYESLFNDLTNFKIVFEENLSNLVKNFNVLVELNGLVVETYEVDFLSFKNIAYDFSLFSYEKNLLKVMVVFEDTNVLKIKNTELTIVGKIKTKKLTYSNVMFEHSNKNNETIIIYDYANSKYMQKHSDVATFVGQAKINFASLNEVKNITQMAYFNHVQSGSYVNHELCFVMTKTGDKALYVVNETKTKELKILNFTPSCYLLMSVNMALGGLMFLYVDDLKLHYKLINLSLLVVKEGSFNFSFISGIEKLVAVNCKEKNSKTTFDFLVVTKQNHVYAVQLKYAFSNFSLTSQPLFLQKNVVDAFSVNKNSITIINYLCDDGSIKQCKYVAGNGLSFMKKTYEKTILNADLCFSLDDEQMCLLFKNKFFYG